jgi:hypothetical protein
MAIVARSLVWTILAAVMAGCATSSQQVRQVDALTAADGSAHILLFEPDIKFYALTAGGVSEPQPDWTQDARRHFVEAARAEAASHDLELTTLDTSVPDLELERYEKLYQAVGMTILRNYVGPWTLPTKEKKKFDLTLGPGVDVLRERYGADYGLFVFYRDYRSTGGRMAFAILAAVVGVGVPTGGQFGFASLVDLRTGDVVWFNKVDIGTGDLRETSGAKTTVAVLFGDMPGA